MTAEKKKIAAEKKRISEEKKKAMNKENENGKPNTIMDTTLWFSVDNPRPLDYLSVSHTILTGLHFEIVYKKWGVRG